MLEIMDNIFTGEKYFQIILMNSNLNCCHCRRLRIVNIPLYYLLFDLKGQVVMEQSPCYNQTLSPDSPHPAGWSQWVGALLGSVLVGLTGVLPLFLVPSKLGGSVNDESLKYMLGFAVGGLLGDVFLHLLPETYQHVQFDYHGFILRLI